MIASLIQDITDVRDLRQQREAEEPKRRANRAFDGVTPHGLLRYRDDDGVISIHTAQYAAAPGPAKRQRGLAGLLRHLRGRN
jgi:hypothetical protein